MLENVTFSCGRPSAPAGTSARGLPAANSATPTGTTTHSSASATPAAPTARRAHRSAARRSGAPRRASAAHTSIARPAGPRSRPLQAPPSDCPAATVIAARTPALARISPETSAVSERGPRGRRGHPAIANIANSTATIAAGPPRPAPSPAHGSTNAASTQCIAAATAAVAKTARTVRVAEGRRSAGRIGPRSHRAAAPAMPGATPPSRAKPPGSASGFPYEASTWRSPIRTGIARRFAGGARGHAQRGS